LKSIDPVVSTDPQYSTIAELEKGDPLVLSPKNKYSLTANYTLPLPSAIGRVSLGVTFVHTDKQLSNYIYLHSPDVVANLGADYGTLKARNLVNANVGWDDIMGLPLDVSLFGTNLSNQKYYSFVAGLVGAGFESATLAEPRMYGARLRYKF
jgi:iron complex outermembrane receptor protein